MNTTSAVAGERLLRACSSFWTSGSQRSGDFFVGADFSSVWVKLAAVSGLVECSVARSVMAVRSASRWSERWRGDSCIGGDSGWRRGAGKL